MRVSPGAKRMLRVAGSTSGIIQLFSTSMLLPIASLSIRK